MPGQLPFKAFNSSIAPDTRHHSPLDRQDNMLPQPPTPISDSLEQPSDDEDDVESDDDDEPRYCVCKGYDEGAMIGCDGGCDDWFVSLPESQVVRSI